MSVPMSQGGGEVHGKDLAWKSWYTDSTDFPEKFSLSIRHCGFVLSPLPIGRIELFENFAGIKIFVHDRVNRISVSLSASSTRIARTLIGEAGMLRKRHCSIDARDIGRVITFFFPELENFRISSRQFASGAEMGLLGKNQSKKPEG